MIHYLYATDQTDITSQFLKIFIKPEHLTSIILETLIEKKSSFSQNNVVSFTFTDDLCLRRKKYISEKCFLSAYVVCNILVYS